MISFFKWTNINYKMFQNLSSKKFTNERKTILFIVDYLQTLYYVLLFHYSLYGNKNNIKNT